MNPSSHSARYVRLKLNELYWANTRKLVPYLFAIILLGEPASRNVIAQVVSTDTAGITAAVEGFHRALEKGDRAAALALLAPDATILESGESQTRTDYEREHLNEDIAFAHTTTTERSPLKIQQEGNVAWTIAMSKTTGTFNGRKIDSAGAELIVLTRQDGEWRIRAIYWSNRR